MRLFPDLYVSITLSNRNSSINRGRRIFLTRLPGGPERILLPWWYVRCYPPIIELIHITFICMLLFKCHVFVMKLPELCVQRVILCNCARHSEQKGLSVCIS